MAELDFILQAVTTANHAKALQALLALPNPTEVLVSVEFVKEPGLESVEEAIKPLASKTRFFMSTQLFSLESKVAVVAEGSRESGAL
ncbi:MAG: hypothetical protein ABSC47_03990 [Terracidiphilus sp.]|jgi:hypothetical protein